ncbi:MAG: DUF1861 family protein [Ideonella sp.]|nr:DUF1861 family protein [Ideonella sp.]
MNSIPSDVARVADLIQQFKHRAAGAAPRPRGRLVFHGVDGLDVYNPTAPFESAGRHVIAGRVERRDSEQSQVRFFERGAQGWHLIPDAPTLALQDPFFTFIGATLVLGGVETFDIGGRLHWRTVFLRGPDIFNLSRFLVGPDGMKDIRLTQLADGRIGIFTRPQGAVGGRGTIGYIEADHLDAITPALISGATLLKGMFHPLDWGGANETKALPGGEVGVLAHVACFDNDEPSSARHYVACTFVFDPHLRRWRDFRIVACRSQFVAGPAKRSDLVDVVFSSGLVFDAEGRVTLYAGASDAEAHWLEIDDPYQARRP